VYFPQSFELDVMMKELLSKAKEISDVVELVTPRSVLMRSRPLDHEDEEESSVVFTSITIRDSKEVCVSVHTSTFSKRKKNVFRVIRHGLMRWRKRNLARAFKMWQRLVMSPMSLKEREVQVEQRTRQRTLSSEYNESCKQEALRMTIGLVRDLIHRVNQRLLLRNMYDTQQISRLLLRESESVLTSKTNKFSPGCFACPIQRETKFKVHFRLKAVVALNAVTRSVLLAFLLRYVDMKSESKLLDRECFMSKTSEKKEETANTTKYMFFYRDRKSQVMYLTLSVAESNQLCLRAYVVVFLSLNFHNKIT